MPFQNYSFINRRHTFVGDFAHMALAKFLKNGIQGYSKVFVLTDRNTKKYCLPWLMNHFRLPDEIILVEMEAGELHKTLETCRVIWRELAQTGADRKSLLVCIGGGVVCDLGGFVASAYMRGIACIYLPTSLLAQIDASVGGKTGVDLDGLKNYIGAYSKPKKIFIFPEFLKTLPFEHLLSGFGELVKHALIEGHEEWGRLKNSFANIESLKNFPHWQELIAHSVELKHKIVSLDPRETGSRKVLNLGHTVGHALETYSLRYDKKPLLHGHAIAIGIMVELQLSDQAIDYENSLVREITQYLMTFFPKYSLRSDQVEALIDLMFFDKKNHRDQLNMTLLRDIGQPVINCHCSVTEVIHAIHKCPAINTNAAGRSVPTHCKTDTSNLNGF